MGDTSASKGHRDSALDRERAQHFFDPTAHHSSRLNSAESAYDPSNYGWKWIWRDIEGPDSEDDSFDGFDVDHIASAWRLQIAAADGGRLVRQ
jgi:hypothetical protein